MARFSTATDTLPRAAGENGTGDRTVVVRCTAAVGTTTTAASLPPVTSSGYADIAVVAVHAHGNVGQSDRRWRGQDCRSAAGSTGVLVMKSGQTDG
jgi:hypothetical protein